MNKEEKLLPHIRFWLSQDTKHDCHFIVGPASGPNKRIGSFKAFLIGHSEPFRAMLEDSEMKTQGDISIVDIHPDTFTHFLKCVYMNCENISKENLSFQDCIDLLYVADKYLVTYVKDNLVDYMLHALQCRISLNDFFTALSSPVVLNEKRLEKILNKIIISRIKEIFSSPLFLKMSSDSLLWILKLDNVGTNEITLWQELLKWAIHNTGSEDGSVLRQCMLKHLQFIRFCTMSYNDFWEKVVPTDILTHGEVYEICKLFGLNKPPNMEVICNNTIQRYKSNEDFGFTYLYCFNNINNLNEELCSQFFEFQELEWSIFIEKFGDYLSLYLYCESENPSKQLSVTCELVLINHTGNNLSRSLTQLYDNKKYLGFKQFCSWSELMNPSKKYILYNSIIVLVNITCH